MKPKPNEDHTMTQIKTQIDSGTYAVDTGKVAEEILTKLHLLRVARSELIAPAGPTPRTRLRDP